MRIFSLLALLLSVSVLGQVVRIPDFRSSSRAPVDADKANPGDLWIYWNSATPSIYIKTNGVDQSGWHLLTSGGTGAQTGTVLQAGSITTGRLAKFTTQTNVTDAVDGTDYLRPLPRSSLTYASSITLDLSTNSNFWLFLTGNTTFSASSYNSNVTTQIRINGDTSDRTVIFPSTWIFPISGDYTNTLPAYKVGLVVIQSDSTSATNVLFSWSSN